MEIKTYTAGNNITFTGWDEILAGDCSKISYMNSHISGRVNLNYKGCLSDDFASQNSIEDRVFGAPVLSHLLYHEDYGNFLVDAGLDKSFEKNMYGRQKGTLLHEYGSKFIQEPGTSTQDYIRKNNINLSGVFITHMHIDHIAGLADLDDNIPVYFSSNEKSMDLKPFYYAGIFRNKKFINILDINTFTGTPTAGLCYDIFGDESLYAIYTPGHTQGHLSYLVNSQQKILIAGDVCYINDSIKYKSAPADYTHNTREAQNSLEKLIEFSEKYNITILPGHEKII